MAGPDERVELTQVAETLDKLQKQREEPDVTLVCGTRHFKVHRSILSDASPYFRSMFASAWKEALTGTVEMPTISEKTMEVIIEFIYREKTPKAICAWDLCLDVAESAHFMEIPDLFSTCLHKLIKHANLNSIVKLFSLVELYNNWSINSRVATGISSWGLNARIETFLARRFSRYIRKEEFLHMDLLQLKNVLQHPELDIVSLEDLLTAVLKWVDADFENRQADLHDILCALHPSFITSPRIYCNILDILSLNKGVNDFSQIIEIVKTTSSNECLMHDCSEFGKKLLFIGTDYERYPIMKTYDLTTNQWKNVDQPPSSVLDCAKAVGYGRHIYFLCTDNRSNSNPQTKITRYCPYSNVLISTSTLQQPVHNIYGTCGLHGAVYILGDVKKKNKVTNIMQRYCPGMSICENVSAMDDEFSAQGMFASTNYLYAVCSSKEDRNKDLLRYDPLFDAWTEITKIPKDCSSYAFNITNEKLFMVDEDLMIVYDIISDQWMDYTFNEEELEMDKVWLFMQYGKELLLAQDCDFVTELYEAQSPSWKKDLLKREDFMPPRFQLHYGEMLRCILY